ncbi:hypothetical protein D7V72_04945 [bacterium D16-36]|jgi:hypothetical protein|nr:hypothetical protein D7V72_04945 [bacterium D16-36]
MVFILQICYPKDICELIRGTFMTAEKAWDYVIGMIKVDGTEPTRDFNVIIKRVAGLGLI